MHIKGGPTMKKLSLITATLFLFLSGTVSTATAAFYTNWTYDIQYGFSTYSPTPGVTGTVPNTKFNNYPTTLSWGTSTGSGQSSLVINPFGITGTTTLDTIDESTPFVDGPTLTHNNNPITGTTLDTATLSSELVIHPTGVSGLDVIYEFSVDFFETPNDGIHPDDIFVIQGLDSFLFPFTIGSDPQKYVLDFDIEGLENIGNNTAAANYLAGVGYTLPTNAVGFITVEGQSNAFATQFRIMGKEAYQASTVPEPATMFLFGLGLLGVAGVSRRKK